MDRADVLRGLHRSRDLCRPGETEGREREIANKLVSHLCFPTLSAFYSLFAYDPGGNPSILPGPNPRLDAGFGQEHNIGPDFGLSDSLSPYADCLVSAVEPNRRVLDSELAVLRRNRMTLKECVNHSSRTLILLASACVVASAATPRVNTVAGG